MSTRRKRVRKGGHVFKMYFSGPESIRAYKEMMSRMNQIDEKDQPLLGGQRQRRFNKIDLTPEQGVAFTRLIEGSNRVNTADRTKIGGDALIR